MLHDESLLQTEIILYKPHQLRHNCCCCMVHFNYTSSNNHSLNKSSRPPYRRASPRLSVLPVEVHAAVSIKFRNKQRAMTRYKPHLLRYCRFRIVKAHNPLHVNRSLSTCVSSILIMRIPLKKSIRCGGSLGYLMHAMCTLQRFICLMKMWATFLEDNFVPVLILPIAITLDYVDFFLSKTVNKPEK